MKKVFEYASELAESKDNKLISLVFMIILFVVFILYVAYPITMSFKKEVYYFSELKLSYYLQVSSILMFFLISLLVYVKIPKNRSFLVSKDSETSKKIVNEIYGRIRKELKKGNTNFTVYDLNLQTSRPARIFDPDIELVRLLKEHKVDHHVLFTINNSKKSFVEEWKNSTGFHEDIRHKLYKLTIPENDWPLPNIFIIPEFNIVFIGMADYEIWGFMGNGEPTKGGGFLVKNDDKFSNGLKGISNFLISKK
jgi:uncharacterized protein with PQ loop repeat